MFETDSKCFAQIKKINEILEVNRPFFEIIQKRREKESKKDAISGINWSEMKRFSCDEKSFAQKIFQFSVDEHRTFLLIISSHFRVLHHICPKCHSHSYAPHTQYMSFDVSCERCKQFNLRHVCIISTEQGAQRPNLPIWSVPVTSEFWHWINYKVLLDASLVLAVPCPLWAFSDNNSVKTIGRYSINYSFPVIISIFAVIACLLTMLVPICCHQHWA